MNNFPLRKLQKEKHTHKNELIKIKTTRMPQKWMANAVSWFISWIRLICRWRKCHRRFHSIQRLVRIYEYIIYEILYYISFYFITYFSTNVIFFSFCHAHFLSFTVSCVYFFFSFSYIYSKLIIYLLKAISHIVSFLWQLWVHCKLNTIETVCMTNEDDYDYKIKKREEKNNCKK